MSPADRHWLHVFSTFDVGGPQLRTVQIIEALPRDTRHTIIAMDGRTGCADRLPGDARIDLLEPPSARGFRAMGRAMGQRIEELSPDLLLTYNWGAIESLLGAGHAGMRAVVHHEEGFGPEEFEGLLWRRNWARRWLLRRAHAVVVPSLRLQELARRCWKQPAGRLHYLPNGIDLARFTPTERGAGDEPVIGCVSALRPEKNQSLLLAAFARMKSREGARLLLIGDGPDRESVRALADELGITSRVTFAGSVADTATVYGDMDLFALSSRTEQMPLVVLEAMACGLAVVATDVGDVRSMLSPQNREWIAAPEDADGLARILDAALADPALRRRLGMANRRRCEEEFPLRECLDRYLAIYESALHGP